MLKTPHNSYLRASEEGLAAMFSHLIPERCNKWHDYGINLGMRLKLTDKLFLYNLLCPLLDPSSRLHCTDVLYALMAEAWLNACYEALQREYFVAKTQQVFCSE